jgi:indolepyruvate ferredoxin oxidoreductase beta subunit
MTATIRPISLTLAALGGQGGGVVSGWLTNVARRAGYVVQATSVPGVAQRTGATIYYLEFFPEAALPADGRRPVMALMPGPGDVDIVVASELVEAGRAMQRGLVTPDRTTLITSTHRDYTISEKSNHSDGRADGARILERASLEARRLIAYDMAALAERSGAVISSVLLGAIAGASGLPFTEESYRQAIRDSGITVGSNLAAFEASLARARTGGEPIGQTSSAPNAVADASALPAALAKRIRDELPSLAWTTAVHGVRRLIDYQDEAYAAEYLDRLGVSAGRDRAAGNSGRLTEAVGRGLALWMSLEDTIRVADLKTRPERRARILREVKARPDQVVRVSEYLKPRIEEICGTLPAGLGRRLLASAWWRRRLQRFTRGRTVYTTNVAGFMLLRAVAGLRRWRRGTLRFVEERARWTRWLQQVDGLAVTDYELAVEYAESQRLVRGYGDTYERGRASFERISVAAVRLAGQPGAARDIVHLRQAALADDRGEALGAAMAAIGLS